MEQQRKAIAAEEAKRQYTPSFREQYEQTISEIRSQIRSLENAVMQLQREVYRDRNESAAPLGINLDEVGPPPWLQPVKKQSDHAKLARTNTGLTSKLLARTPANGSRGISS